MLLIISANRLTDGHVVFRNSEGRWTEEFAAAAVIEGDIVGNPAIEAAKTDVARNLVVEVEPVEVFRVGKELRPAHLRDRIRMQGPSVLQAGQTAQPAVTTSMDYDDVSI